MNILFALIAGPLLGWFMKSLPLGIAIYLASTSLLFTFQSITVLLAWMGDEGGFFGLRKEGAFGPAPTGFPVSYAEGELYSYGIVNLVITLVGLGVVVLFGRIRARRDARRNSVAIP
jgi:hypothetical protein